MNHKQYSTAEKYKTTTIRMHNSCPNLTLSELSFFLNHLRVKAKTDLNWDPIKKTYLPTKEYQYNSKYGVYFYRYHRSKNLITLLDFERSYPLK